MRIFKAFSLAAALMTAAPVHAQEAEPSEYTVSVKVNAGETVTEICAAVISLENPEFRTHAGYIMGVLNKFSITKREPFVYALNGNSVPDIAISSPGDLPAKSTDSLAVRIAWKMRECIERNER